MKLAPAQTAAPATGGGGVGPAPAPYLNNLLNSDGRPVSFDVRQSLARAEAVMLTVFRFTDEAETFYALGVWATRLYARPPAVRHTGYATREVARYYTEDVAGLPEVAAALLALAPAYTPARPLGAAHCFADPWPALLALPAGARRMVPSIVQGPSSPHRPEPVQVQRLRRQLAEAEARQAAVEALEPAALVRVELPVAGQPPLRLSLPAGAELLGAAKEQFAAQIADLRQRLASK